MSRTPQEIYASNLLCVQTFGYPLRNPSPGTSNAEGCRIGDVGYVDALGEFKVVLNINSGDEERHGRALGFDLDHPYAKPAFHARQMFMAGVVRKNLVAEKPRADFEFTTTRGEGAILILPDGAVLSEIQDEDKLKQIRKHAERCASQWCAIAKRNSLYLITAVYKSKSWTLGSFEKGTPGKEILVQRQSCNDSRTDSTYEWTYEINVVPQQGPGNNYYVNQTVLIKGFKMTVMWGLLPIVEQVEKTRWWITNFFLSLWSTFSQRWLSPVVIDYFPFLNFSQPRHPLDIINRIILEKNPEAQVAVTHDEDWISMLKRGLLPEYLMQEEQLQEFVLKEHLWELDSNHQVVFLRDSLEDTNGERSPARGSSLLQSGNSPLVIIHMRLESVDIDHIYAGVCVLVQFACMTRRTQNKPHADVVEWDDEVILPSDLPVTIKVCGVFQLGSTLGTRNIFTEQTIMTKDLSGDTHVIRFSCGKTEACSSLLITLGRHVSPFEPPLSREEKSDFVEATISGLKSLYSYHDDPKEEHLERALGIFRRTLEQSKSNSSRYATALFNLATSKLIRCQTYGKYSEVNEPIEQYEQALDLRGPGHPDRPGTLLLLSQALLSHLGQEYNESVATRIQHLLKEILHVNSRERRTADTIARTCRLYRGISSRNLSGVDISFDDLECCSYVPPYGYFDRPHLLHKLGVALWERFQQNSYLHDLEKSVALNQEALRLIPDRHDNRGSIVVCLSRSLPRCLEARMDLTDVDMSANLVQFEERVVTVLDPILIEGNKWASRVLIRSSADATLATPTKLNLPKFLIHSVICDVLEGSSRVKEAVACLRQMRNELVEDVSFRNERLHWELDFQHRCKARLEKLGDIAVDSKNYNDAVEHFTVILELDRVNHVDVLIKRSKAWLLMELWDEALSDADKVITLHPSSHQGYELKQAALYGACRYLEAVEALDAMLSVLWRTFLT